MIPRGSTKPISALVPVDALVLVDAVRFTEPPPRKPFLRTGSLLPPKTARHDSRECQPTTDDPDAPLDDTTLSEATESPVVEMAGPATASYVASKISGLHG